VLPDHGPNAGVAAVATVDRNRQNPRIEAETKQRDVMTHFLFPAALMALLPRRR
jgi:hypothetical protein